MRVLENLKPNDVFSYFEDICSIPHGSGNTKKISDYLCTFAQKNGLYSRQDESGNVVIKKPAQNSANTDKPVIIQGHIDMVAVKSEDSDKDLENEGLTLLVDNEYIYADKTSLGADDGIAVAYALAVLANKEISHPPIEAVFTVDEEIGMLGAEKLDVIDITGKLMLNIDSEEEGFVLCGCAGGATVNITFEGERKEVCGAVVEVKLTGLTSGHSGTDIVFQRANANVLIGRMLFEIGNKFDIRLISVAGGEKDNSIPAFAKASFVVDETDKEEVISELSNIAETVKKEYLVTDPDMKIEISEISETSETTALAFDLEQTKKILGAFVLIPDGVVKMSNDIAGLVQTSLNLGVVKCFDDTVSLTYLIRSSVESEKNLLVKKLKAACALLGAKSKVYGVYPAWEFKQESLLRNLFLESYEQMLGKKAEAMTMHAGVECGIFSGKIKELDCISFGPDIKDIHTYKEKLDIASAIRTYDLLIRMLERLSKL